MVISSVGELLECSAYMLSVFQKLKSQRRHCSTNYTVWILYRQTGGDMDFIQYVAQAIIASDV